MADRAVKQVIVMRKDLNMRKGKMVAQGAHASLGAVLMIQNVTEPKGGGPIPWDEPLKIWLNGTFTKVCVGVSSYEELLDIAGQAALARMPVKCIVDAGQTEFRGVPTNTCLAIGPFWSDEIDKVTGHLGLL